MEEAVKKEMCSFCDRLYTDVKRHILDKHASVLVCGFCQAKLNSATDLIAHLRQLHPHILGCKPPASPHKNLKITRAFTLEKFHEHFEIGSNVKLLETDWYLTGVCTKTGRELFNFYCMNEVSLKKMLGKNAQTSFRKFLRDSEYPETEIDEDAKNTDGYVLLHLTPSRDLEISQAANDASVWVRNGCAGRKKVNGGPLKGLEHHFRVAGPNWDWTGILTSLKYDNSGRKATIGGVLKEIPSDIQKLAIFGGTEVQTFSVPNEDPDPENHRNFTFYKTTMDKAINESDIKAKFNLPYSWASDKIFICYQNECSTTFKTLLERRIHMYFRHEKKKKHCPSCLQPIDCESEEEFRTHVMKCKLVECSECQEVCFNAAKLKLHKKWHVKGDFQCLICNKKFEFQQRYLEHVKTHKKKKPARCDVCKKDFKHMKSLSNHLRRFHKKFDKDGKEASLFKQHQKVSKRMTEAKPDPVKPDVPPS